MSHQGPPTVDAAVQASRRQLVADSLGIVGSVTGFGLVYGLTARAAGLSPIEVMAMGTVVFAGAAQFAAIAYVVAGFSWAGVVLLTAFINARHLLYSAALAPYFAGRPWPLRALIAHFLTDEAFALALSHFRRLGRGDLWGYWWGAIVAVFIPWNLATLAGVVLGGQIPEPGRLGLDVIFPAAMAGLAVGLISGRRELVATIVGAFAAVGVSLAWNPTAGIVAGGLLGPLAAMATPRGPADRPRRSILPFAPVPEVEIDPPAKVPVAEGR